MSEIDLTLLSKKEVFGPGGLDIFRKHSAKAYLTDFGYVTGAENTHYYTEDETVSEMDDRPLRITADYWLRSSNPYGYPHFVYLNGSIDSIYGGLLTKGIRPIIQNPTCFDVKSYSRGITKRRIYLRNLPTMVGSNGKGLVARKKF